MTTGLHRIRGRWFFLGCCCAVLGVLVLQAGCDFSQSAPPPPPPFDSTGGETPILTLGLVVPEEGYLEASVWEQVFRIRAAERDVLSEVVRAPVGKQAEAIRELAGRGIAALVVAPDPKDDGVPAALAEARAGGLPIVLLDRKVELEGSKIPVVHFSPIEDSARRLVQAAIEDAKKAGFPPDGPAVVFVNGPYDEKGRRRVEAIRGALKEANLRLLPDCVFQGYMTEAGDALKATLKAHPEVAIVIADEEQGARAAATTRDQAEDAPRRFVLAAFGGSRELAQLMKFNLLAAMVEYNLEEQTDRALQAAIALARSEPVEADIVIEPRFTRASGPEARGFLPRASPGAAREPGVPPDGR